MSWESPHSTLKKSSPSFANLSKILWNARLLSPIHPSSTHIGSMMWVRDANWADYIPNKNKKYKYKYFSSTKLLESWCENRLKKEQNNSTSNCNTSRSAFLAYWFLITRSKIKLNQESCLSLCNLFQRCVVLSEFWPSISTFIPSKEPIPQY